MKLTCPFHFLAYQIECEYRASQGDDLVHPDLKKGHSNWVEASHNVLIRFRPKRIHLERLHYALSTDLGFLQANMTFNYDFLGAKYHWQKDLFAQLGLPAYEGVEDMLYKQNIERKKYLNEIKSSKKKRARILNKSNRMKENEERKSWVKYHGRHTYGDETLEKSDLKAKGECKACGRTDHKRSTHKNCPFNKAKRVTDSKVKVKDSSSVQPKSRRKIKDVTDSEVPFKVSHTEEFAKVEEYITVHSEQSTDCSSFTNDSESSMSVDNFFFLRTL